jgi:outer membrane protein assembly factor BamB
MNRATVVSLLVVATGLVGAVQGADSARFRGPAGDGVFSETGLLKQWPQGGPKLAWSADGLGPGYSSAVIVDQVVYVTGMDDQNQGLLFAFGLDGSPKWKTAYGPEFVKAGPAPTGTRGTPTVDGDRIFVVTGHAVLAILDAEKGSLLKTVNLVERFGAKPAQFGFAESVLVDGRKVICTPGGPDALLAALDRDTGETIWQTGGTGQGFGYCSARLIRHDGKPLILTMTAQGVIAVDPETGQVRWQHEYPHRAGVQPNPPLYADGSVYVCSGMGTGGAMLSLADSSPTATPKWTDRTLDCQIHGTVMVDGHIYGTAQSGNRGLVCLDWSTGQAKWNAPVTGMASVVTADGMLYVYGQNGAVYLVKPSADGFQPAGQFTVPKGTDEHWAHPTIANGRLYIRHGDALMAYDIEAGS